MRQFIACCADSEGGTSAENTASFLLQNVWKLHGLPSTIVSDRGTQFTSEMWRHLCRMLEINCKLSTAFHPETDGQTEIVNSEMERYIRTYVNYHQDDWVRWLWTAEFAVNYSESATTKTTPFFANYGFVPRMSFDPNPELEIPTTERQRIEREKAIAMGTKMQAIWTAIQDEISLSQSRMENFANEGRSVAPRYRSGDRV